MILSPLQKWHGQATHATFFIRTDKTWVIKAMKKVFIIHSRPKGSSDRGHGGRHEKVIKSKDSLCIFIHKSFQLLDSMEKLSWMAKLNPFKTFSFDNDIAQQDVLYESSVNVLHSNFINPVYNSRSVFSLHNNSMHLTAHSVHRFNWFHM